MSTPSHRTAGICPFPKNTAGKALCGCMELVVGKNQVKAHFKGIQNVLYHEVRYKEQQSYEESLTNYQKEIPIIPWYKIDFCDKNGELDIELLIPVLCLSPFPL